jgi:nonsense-mediated mRNA decay protein 3
MGYHLRVANFNSAEWDTLPADRLPDVVLVKKSYPERKKRSKNRMWKLKSMAKEAEDPATEGAVGRGAVGRRGGLDSQRVERDYELFLRELEEDDEMRQTVNLYRDTKKEEEKRLRKERAAQIKAEREAALANGGMEEDGDDGMTTDGESEWGDDDAPRVGMDELLDDLEDMAIED